MLGTITGVRSEIKEKVFANVSLIRVKLHLSDTVRGQDVSDVWHGRIIIVIR